MVNRLCERLYVLEFGRVHRRRGRRPRCIASEAVQEAYLGTERVMTRRAAAAWSRGLRAGYGRGEVLHGVDLAVGTTASSSPCSARTAPASRRC